MKNKVGISFILFDGSEILEYAINNIKDSVDYINVVYSDYSYLGVKISQKELDVRSEVFERLKNAVDNFIFTYLVSNNRHIVETEKRNIGLKDCLKNGVNIYSSFDNDEFYNSECFNVAKQNFIIYGLTHSYCNILDYKSTTELSNDFKENYFVPFLSRVNENSKHEQNKNIPCLIDCTRGLNDIDNTRHFVMHNIYMNHYRNIRNEIKDKYFYTQFPEYENIYKNTIKVENYFNIDL